jgi:hypothetical protein
MHAFVCHIRHLALINKNPISLEPHDDVVDSNEVAVESWEMWRRWKCSLKRKREDVSSTTADAVLIDLSGNMTDCSFNVGCG